VLQDTTNGNGRQTRGRVEGEFFPGGTKKGGEGQLYLRENRLSGEKHEPNRSDGMHRAGHIKRRADHVEGWGGGILQKTDRTKTKSLKRVGHLRRDIKGVSNDEQSTPSCGVTKRRTQQCGKEDRQPKGEQGQKHSRTVKLALPSARITEENLRSWNHLRLPANNTAQVVQESKGGEGGGETLSEWKK